MLASIVSPEASRTPGRRAVLDEDLLDFRLQPQFAALRLDQPDEAADQRPHAAHGVMDAELPLRERDQAIDRARPERVAADQQRMEAEHGPQPLVAQIFRHEAVDAAVAFEPEEVGGDARHVDEAN